MGFKTNPLNIATFQPFLIPWSSFREIPCHSVASIYSFLPLFHTLKPTKPPSFLVGHLVISNGRKIIENFTKIMI
jgi:hypothetical protein